MLLYNGAPISDKKYASEAEIIFIGYTGCDYSATLCMGELELDINGKRYRFNRRELFCTPRVCWANSDCENKMSTCWDTEVTELPEELRCYAKQIDEIINERLPNNICRGCD